MSRVSVTPAEEQAVCSHLIKRGSRYSIRRKIPVDLQSHYGRTQIVKALGTSDRREAEQLCRIEGVKGDVEFASVRAALAASAPTQPTPAPPAPLVRPFGSTRMRLHRERSAHRRDAAAAQGYEALAAFNERMRRGLDDQEVILCGDSGKSGPDPVEPSRGHGDASRAVLVFIVVVS